MNSITSRFSLFFLSICLCFAAGCGSQYKDVVTFDGTVTFDGQAVSGLQMSFSPEQGRTSSATLDDQGGFSMYYAGDTQGVQKGSGTVQFFEPYPGGPEAPAFSPNETQKKLLDYQVKNGPLKIEITKAEKNYVLALPR